MVEIPDDIRGYLKQLQKYHFWLLALLMPLILVPLAFTADAQLLREIDTRSSAVKAKVESINSVPRKTAEGLERIWTSTTRVGRTDISVKRCTS